ncbi:MAG: SDR family oxidoreductase [Bacteroidetes bacterium]|nr:SDR family oxidoreductase [Bacteroidota bacterium]
MISTPYTEKLVIPFDQLSIKDIGKVGGKNASLGELHRHLRPFGIRIPDGFSVTAAGYTLFLQENNLEHRIAATLAALDTHHFTNLQQDKVTDALWEKILSVNVHGPFYASRLAITAMLQQGKGVIINIASIGGIAGARAGLAYTTSKHALIGMSKNIGFMYAQKGIRCNAIAPRGVNTNIMKNAHPDAEGAALCSSGSGSMPRMGESEEIAKVALFLASEDSSFVNGETLVADGGWLAY